MTTHDAKVDLVPARPSRERATGTWGTLLEEEVPRVPMAKSDVAKVMDLVIGRMQFLREQGQAEYAHRDDRPFKNFENLAAELDIPREKALFVLMKKHMDGITAYVNGHRSQRESIHGRFGDLHVYLVLLEAMIIESEGYHP